jgi:hypothetical protein
MPATPWLALAGVIVSLGGCVCLPCTQDSHGGPFALRQTWMVGMDRMRGDAEPGLPYTNRLLADLAAMPGVQVVYTGTERNAWPFQADPDRRLRLATWLHGGGACMTANYSAYAAGQQEGSYALTTPVLYAGSETDLGCIDRFATDFYLALVRQGF